MNQGRSRTKARASHFFQLTPKFRNASNGPVKISFKPVPKKDMPMQNTIKRPEKPLSNKIIPCFIKDGKYFTPSFVIPFIYEYRSELERQFVVHHMQRVKESLEEIPSTQILVPKPRRGASMFCSVCRQHYEDYRDHIMSEQHKATCRRHPFTISIQELCEKINKIPEAQRIQIAPNINLKRSYKHVWYEQQCEQKLTKKVTCPNIEEGSLTMLQKSSSKLSTGQEVAKGPTLDVLVISSD